MAWMLEATVLLLVCLGVTRTWPPLERAALPIGILGAFGIAVIFVVAFDPVQSDRVSRSEGLSVPADWILVHTSWEGGRLPFFKAKSPTRIREYAVPDSADTCSEIERWVSAQSTDDARQYESSWVRDRCAVFTRVPSVWWAWLLNEPSYRLSAIVLDIKPYPKCKEERTMARSVHCVPVTYPGHVRVRVELKGKLGF